MKAIPTTEPAQRISIMFKRRLTTPWAEHEIKQYKKLVLAGCFKNMDDLDLLERYYVFERRKEDKGIHRRDLDTFLNNYHGELDRARLWDARFRRPIKAKPKNGETPTSDEEWQRIGQVAKTQLEQFKKAVYHHD